jgi:Ca2+:H+ antiporter
MNLKVTVTAVILFVCMATSYLSKTILQISLLTFATSGLSLAIFSRYSGMATEELVKYLGQRLAGLVNVTLSNLPELIIIFVAILHNKTELVQGGIIGSMIGNLLLVLGFSIVVGCKRNGTMRLDKGTVSFFLVEIVIVGVVYFCFSVASGMMLPEKRQTCNLILAILFVVGYFGFMIFLPPKERLQAVNEQAEKLDHRWPWQTAVAVLTGSVVGTLGMSHLMIGEVEAVSKTLGWSQQFMGMVVVPFMGNIAEHSVAVTAAYKKLTDLSMAISLGSATQVGMVVAPVAVLFGLLTGKPVMLYFPLFAGVFLVGAVVCVVIVLRDNLWSLREGYMLLFIMSAITTLLYFIQ